MEQVAETESVRNDIKGELLQISSYGVPCIPTDSDSISVSYVAIEHKDVSTGGIYLKRLTYGSYRIQLT